MWYTNTNVDGKSHNVVYCIQAHLHVSMRCAHIYTYSPLQRNETLSPHKNVFLYSIFVNGLVFTLMLLLYILSYTLFIMFNFFEYSKTYSNILFDAAADFLKSL